MRKFFIFFLFTLLLLHPYQPVAAQDYEFVRKNQFSISTGMEYLNYQESDPELPLNSESKPSSAVLRVKYKTSVSSKLMFVGKLTFPVALQPRSEEWKSGSVAIQTNSLEYRWTHFDGYLLSEYENNFSFLFGLRMGQANQTRANFVTAPPAPAGEVVETINSLGLMTGFQTEAHIKKTGVKVHALYVFPVAVRVTNTAIPTSFNDKKGYTLEGGVEIFFGNKIAAEVIGGKMHWNGSGWKSLPGSTQLVKWPSNDTRYTNLLLTLYF